MEVLRTDVMPQENDVLAQCILAGNSLGNSVFTGLKASFTRSNFSSRKVKIRTGPLELSSGPKVNSVNRTTSAATTITSPW